MPTEISVDEEHDLRCRERGYGDQNHSSHHKVEPHQQGHATKLHTRASHAENGSDNVDRGCNAPESRDQQRKCPVIRTVSRRERARAQRRIGPPSSIRCVPRSVQTASPKKTEIQQEATKCRQPETEGIEPGKRHVSGTNHQRDKKVGESEQNGHDHEKDHGCAMHCEHAVKNLWRYKIVVRMHQLDANDESLNPTHHKKHQSVKDVENP